MKKLLSILLAVLMLGGVMTVAASAAPGKATSLASASELKSLLKSLDLKSLSQQELKRITGYLEILKAIGIDYSAILESVRDELPISVKAALHKAGLAKYPIWERSAFFNFFFKVFLFGWIWM